MNVSQKSTQLVGAAKSLLAISEKLVKHIDDNVRTVSLGDLVATSKKHLAKADSAEEDMMELRKVLEEFNPGICVSCGQKKPEGGKEIKG